MQLPKPQNDVVSQANKSDPSVQMTEVLPLTATQAAHYPMLADPDCSARFKAMMMISQAVRIQPGMRTRKLERALKKLVARHDVLRLRFVETDGKLGAIFNPDDAIVLDLRDFGDVGEDKMRQISTDLLNETIPVDAPVLCAFHQLKFGGLGDVIVIRISHMITDAFGTTVLVEDLIKLFLGLPITSSGYSHIDYLQDYEARLPEHKGAVKAYWDDLLSAPPEASCVADIDRSSECPAAPYQITNISEFSTALDPDQVEVIEARAMDAGATLFTTALSGLAEVQNDVFGTEDLIGKFIFSRNSGALANYAGWCLQFPFFRSKMEDADTFLERASTLRDQMSESLQFPSIALAAPVNEIDEALIATRGSGAQVFGHLAAADGRSRSSPFRALFRSFGGQAIEIGPARIERLPVVRKPALAMKADIVMYVVPSDDNTRLVFSGDGDQISTTRLEDIGKRVVEKLCRI